MAVATTTYTGLRDALVATVSVNGLTVYPFMPHTYAKLPALALGLPEIGRVRPAEPEMYLGRNTTFVSWPAELVVLLGTPETAYDDALTWLATVNRAVDLDQSLASQTGSSFPGIHTASLVASAPRFPDDQGRQLIAYDLTFDITLNL